MNAPAKIQHEEWMSDDDIAIYDNLVSLGRLQLGKELAKNEDYLLHIASMITLKQMKGMLLNVNDETIAELKRIHKEHQDAGLIFTTPAEEWYASAEALKAPYLDPQVEKEIDMANAITSNLIVKSCEADKKTSNIADEGNDVLVVEDGVAKIKEGWVKIVEPITQPS
jgi:L-2-hydroxyglutarate oxidase LhgO